MNPRVTHVEAQENYTLNSYIQQLVRDTSAKRPTSGMWAGAAAPFLGILRELRPDAVLVLGRAVEQHLPADFPKEIPKPAPTEFRA